MSKYWKTHKGDEWWFTNYWCEMSGWFMSDVPVIFLISEIKSKPEQLTESRLQELLTITKVEFNDSEVRVSFNHNIYPLFLSLQSKGLIEMKRLQETHRDHLVISSVKKTNNENEPIIESKPKPWWKFW